MQLMDRNIFQYYFYTDTNRYYIHDVLFLADLTVLCYDT